MTDHVRLAEAASARLCALLRELDQSARPGDLFQVLPGIHSEAGIIRGHLREAMNARNAAAQAVTADSPGKVRSDAPATSRAAARAVSVRSGSQRAQVLAYLARQGDYGATDYSVQLALQLRPSSERPRRGELVDMGLVAPTDRTRMHEGTEWTVWTLTPLGEGVAKSLDRGVKSVAVDDIRPVEQSKPDTPDTLF